MAEKREVAILRSESIPRQKKKAKKEIKHEDSLTLNPRKKKKTKTMNRKPNMNAVFSESLFHLSLT